MINYYSTKVASLKLEYGMLFKAVFMNFKDCFKKVLKRFCLKLLKS